MKVNLSDTISYYLYEWDIKHIKEIVTTSYEISHKVNDVADGHGIWEGSQSEEWIKEKRIGRIGDLILMGIDTCKEIYKEDYEYISSSAWINIINASKPKQRIRNANGSLIYHTHTKKAKDFGEPKPDYTFIFYIQMPNNLKGDDGKLFMKDDQGNEIGILPEEGQLIILDGDTPHSPLDAKDSDIDRIVLAGNVCFHKLPLKKKTTLL